MDQALLLFLFFGIALLYSSAGFGGGSSYLALLAIFGLEFTFLRSAALCCNIVVVSGGTYIYWKNGHLNWKKIVPLVFFSVPLAFLGGRVPMQEHFFFILLGLVLFAAAIAMWFQSERKEQPLASPKDGTERILDDWETKANNKPAKQTITNMGIGGSIGFLAGMVGIGGGIFLAPLLHLLRWDAVRSIAGTASFFILVNSLAGLAGQFSQGSAAFDWSLLLQLMVAVFLGGQIGSRLGARRLQPSVIKRWTALLVFLVSLRILYTYLILHPMN